MRRRFVAAMIRRELRTAVRRFGFYGACMAIGIAVVMSLHALRTAVNDAVELRSKELLGADLRLESRDAFGPEDAVLLAPIEAQARAPVTKVTRMGSMVLAERSGRSRLVDLLAIDGRYPIYGDVWTDPPHAFDEFGKRPLGVFVDQSLMIQLDLAVGDQLRIGSQSFEVVAGVVKAPGRFGFQAEVAPRVFLTKQDLDRTGLLTLGSLVTHLRYFELPDGAAKDWHEANEERLDEARIRAQTLATYQEELSEAFGSLTRYLGLVGLAALLLGSIGVAAGMRAFVQEKLEAVALLRSIGATPRDVVAIHAGLAVVLGLAAGLLGIAVCLPILAAVPVLFRGLLPVDVALSLDPAAVATGLALAVWATLLCALGPILDLAAVAPLAALRSDFAAPADRRRVGRAGILLLVGASIFAAAIAQAGSLRVGAIFAAGTLVGVALLAAAAWTLMAGLRRHPPRRFAFWARQGIANLARPRNHTLPTTIAIGFALFVIATVHGVERNVLAALATDARPDRPNVVLFDVQSDQEAGVEALVVSHGARITDRAPIVAARLAAVAGQERARILADESISRDRRWALQREYQLTYHDRPRDTEEVVAGAWWTPGQVDADEEPYPISLEADLAESLGVGVGDRVRWQIQGVPVETVVANLRHVDWGRMATNFFVVFPTAALASAPQSRVLLAHLADEEARAALQREVVLAFPNVSALDATLILRSLDSMFDQIGTAVRILALFTLATGLAILVAASLAARRERVREALLVRILGGSRAVLRRIALSEAVALAALATVVGGVLALAASAGLVVFVFELPFDPPWLELFGIAGATFLLTAGVGGALAVTAPDRSPIEGLRDEAA
ncbi:MAG: FtsX-like permease family protein [Myxococcota bacterium]